MKRPDILDIIDEKWEDAEAKKYEMEER